MSLDLLTYRTSLLWRVIVLGVVPPLVTVRVIEWITGVSHPLLAGFAILLPAVHALRYVGQWRETLTISLILSLCLGMASTMVPELSTGEVAWRVFWLCVLALVLLLIFLIPITALLSGGPMMKIRARSSRRSHLDANALQRAITLYPGRSDERTMCGQADSDGKFVVTVKVAQLDTPNFAIEGDVPEPEAKSLIEEDGFCSIEFFAKVNASCPDYHEVFTFMEGNDEVGVTRYDFESLRGGGTLVSIEETGNSLARGEAFGFWLIGHMDDHLNIEIDRAEGRAPRANLAFVQKQLIVDLANIVLPLVGGQKIEKPPV